jgi:two-component system cell cycle response regulator DivK
VVAATSHAMKGDKEQIMAAGCDDYVAKPLDTRTFAQQVARHVGMRRGT